jgi:muconolactone delta-isomerase
MAYHSENAQAFKSYSKGVLPIVWRSNKKAWVTTNLFEACFAIELHHELKAYVERVEGVSYINENIKVMFLLPNTLSLIQPMDHRVSSSHSSVTTFGRHSPNCPRILTVKTGFL